MSNKERAEQTFKDIKKRQELRKQGERAAKDFIFERMGQAKKERDKIRSKCYRGKW